MEQEGASTPALCKAVERAAKRAKREAETAELTWTAIPANFMNKLEMASDVLSGYWMAPDATSPSNWRFKNKLGIVLSQRLHPNGYWNVSLMIKGTRKSPYVHCIAAWVFLGPAPSTEHTVDHKSRVKTDNRLDNICWADPNEQARNRTKTKRGARVPYDTSLLKDDDRLVFFKHYTTKDGVCVIFKNPIYISEQGRFAIDRSMKFLLSIVSHRARPSITIDGRMWYAHRVQWLAHFPDDPEPSLLEHIGDPAHHPWGFEDLAVGTSSSNGRSAHDNGRYNGTRSERRPVIITHPDGRDEWCESQCAAARAILVVRPDYCNGLMVGVQAHIGRAAKNGGLVAGFRARRATAEETDLHQNAKLIA